MSLASLFLFSTVEASELYSEEELVLLPSVAEPLPENRDASDLLQEIERLHSRLDELEAKETKRSDAEKEKKEADAEKATVKWTGELQADVYWFSQDAANKASYGDIQNGEAFRRARFGMFGDYGPASYRIEVDFAQAGRPTFLDVFTGLDGLPGDNRMRVGHFFEPYGLERETSNRYVTFMERANPEQAFAPARNTGVCVNNTWNEENGTYWLGIFSSDSDVFGDDTGDTFNTAITGRVTMLPYYECEGRQYMHLGSAYSFRGANDHISRFRAQPEARLGAAVPNVPFFVDTGPIPSEFYQLGGLEAAWVHGPLSLQGEYMLTSVDADNGTTPFFDGGYAQVSYFLTGEHRPYNRDLAIFDRVIPNRPFIRYVGDPEDKRTCFGPGAWEIAWRVSHIDLNDAGITGGRITDFTAGLNWYLSPHMRFTSNYVHSMPTDSLGVKSEADIFGMRMQFEF